MSETVHYKGILRKVEKLEGESLEDQCKRLLRDKELPSYCDSYAEHLLDIYYEEMVVLNDVVYQVEKDDVDPYSDMFNATLKENGEISFEVRYYNGGCGFNKAIERAIENIVKQKAGGHK